MSGPAVGWCRVTCHLCGKQSEKAVGWQAARKAAKDAGWSRVGAVFRCPACRVARRTNRPKHTTKQVMVTMPETLYAALLDDSVAHNQTMSKAARRHLAVGLGIEL